MSLIESALKKLSKDELIALALEYLNNFDSTLTNINKEISDLRQNYGKMQSELCVSRQVSSKLKEQIVSLERQCWSNCRYSRREYLELSGLPESRTRRHSSPVVQIAGCRNRLFQKESLLNFPNGKTQTEFGRLRKT